MPHDRPTRKSSCDKALAISLQASELRRDVALRFVARGIAAVQDDIKSRKALNAALSILEELKFVREFSQYPQESELRRILKARLAAAALHCSDGRVGAHFDDFLHNGLSLPRYDRVSLPGGPACLAGHPQAHLEEQGVVAEILGGGAWVQTRRADCASGLSDLRNSIGTERTAAGAGTARRPGASFGVRASRHWSRRH